MDPRSSFPDVATDVLASSSPPWWSQPKHAVGVLAAIAAGLVWFLRSDVVAGQDKLQQLLEAHAKELAAHAQESQAAQEKELQLQFLICQNTAQTERERNQCEAVFR